MNNKTVNLNNELRVLAQPLMAAFKELHIQAGILRQIEENYTRLGFTNDDIFDALQVICLEVNKELYEELQNLQAPTFKQGINEIV